MAAVSARQHERTGTSQHQQGSHTREDWDFGISAGSEISRSVHRTSNADPPSSYQRYDFTNDEPQADASFDGHASQSTDPVSGAIKSPREIHNYDTQYLSPLKNGSQAALDSRSGSEADSLLDLYGNTRGPTSRGPDPASQTTKNSESTLAEAPDRSKDDSSNSRWIHRDKLAAIERQEMKAAGILLPARSIRSTGRPTKVKQAHNEVQPPFQQDEGSGEQGQNGSSYDDHNNHGIPKGSSSRTYSPEQRTEENELPLPSDLDLRTPAEIAAEVELARSASSPMYRQNLRSSSSRIPIPRSSPMPMAQGHTERSTPLPRRRGASSSEEDTLGQIYARSRTNSFGSQILLDDGEPPSSNKTNYSTPIRPPSSGSPAKSRSLNHRTGHVRKTSTSVSTPPSSQNKARSVSGSNDNTPISASSPRSLSSFAAQPSIRPKSRSGLEPRPPTSAINRPEGDPPWLATMFKPDPMLPPEQQLLPTHAKRLQQEQWERAKEESEARQAELAKLRKIDTKTAIASIPHEEPLAIHTEGGLQAGPGSLSKDASTDERQIGKKSEWPLPKSQSATANKQQQTGSCPTSPTSVGPNGENARGSGGYSTMPRINPSQRSSGNQSHAQGMDASTWNGHGYGSNDRKGSVQHMDPFERERRARIEARLDEELDAGGGGGSNEKREKNKSKEGGCGVCCTVM